MDFSWINGLLSSPVDPLDELKTELLALVMLDIIPFDVLEKMAGSKVHIDGISGDNVIDEAKKLLKEPGMEEEVRGWLKDEPTAKDKLLKVVHQRLYLGWKLESGQK
jgi:hypothetical protein